MEWTPELLAVINDELFDDVRLKPTTPTRDDRLNAKAEELCRWIEENGREPSPDGGIKEKLMYKRMLSLKELNLWN